MKLDELEDLLEGGQALFLEPRDIFDVAIIGIAERVDGLCVVAYDSERVVQALMARYGWEESKARDWYNFKHQACMQGQVRRFPCTCESPARGIDLLDAGLRNIPVAIHFL